MRRELMDEIDWNHRLIGIKGARGVGKTTFLLDYAKSAFGQDKACLYINLNNLYFTGRTIVSFADEFRKIGGKTLILDQVYKYPNWSEELKYCYDHFDDLQIIFSGSPVMRLKEENPDLKDRVAAYTLEGFSFREYLNLENNISLRKYSLEEIQQNHVEICQDIIGEIKPLAYFTDYLHHGYYPFFQEKRNYLENLLKTINLVLEIDISYLLQIELKYLPKLRKLLYLVAKSAPFQPNVSKLSAEVETSRATIMNYLNYLKQGKLINLLYEENEDAMKKPSLIYLQNPNLVYSVFHGDVDSRLLNCTFFYNQVGVKHQVNFCRNGDFCVDGNLVYHVGGRYVDEVLKGEKGYYTRDMIEVGKDRQIPLWLYGFLY